MPLNVAAGTSQTTVGWLIRLGFFALVALVVGYGRNRLLELSAARQRFLSTVSHELRTPLASIVGFAALLADRDLDIAECEQNAFVDLILAEATEMANVVDHYVIEGRLLDSALFIDLQPTDMKRVVEVVSDSIPASVRETRLEIRGGRAVCNADPLRLRQVLRSLVNNALAYSSGRIVLEVAAVAGEARLTVSRSVDRSDSDREGRAPWSPPDETSPPFGLGLAVSRDLVQRMGGQLTYQLNGTTNFVLRMPLADRLSSRGRRIQAMAWPIGPHGTPRIG